MVPLDGAGTQAKTNDNDEISRGARNDNPLTLAARDEVLLFLQKDPKPWAC